MVCEVFKKIASAHEDGLWSVVWVRDKIFSGGIDGHIKVWGSDNYQLKHQVPHSHMLGIVKMVVDKNLKVLCSCSLDNSINVFDISDLSNIKLRQKIQASPLDCCSISLSPKEDQLLCSVGNSSVLSVYNITENKKSASIKISNTIQMSCDWSADGYHVCSGSMNGDITIIDVKQERKLHNIEAHTMCVRDVLFSQDNQILYTASDDTTAKIFDMRASYSPIGSLRGHGSFVTSLTDTNDENIVVTGGTDRNVKVWDLRNRQCVFTFNQHEDKVWDVSYNTHTYQAISCGDDNNIITYNIK